MSVFRSYTGGLVVFVPVLAYLATGIAQVQSDERAVVRRFGKVVARPGPGLWIGAPWGVDRVDRFAVRTVRQWTLTAAADAATEPEFLTGDQNLVSVKLVVEYAVDESDSGLDSYLLNRDQVEDVLAREAEGLVGEWVAGQPIDDLLLTGRARLAGWLMTHLPTRLGPHQLGVLVQRVNVEQVAPPTEVRDAFEQVNQAQTGIRTRENQAFQEADQRKRDAETVRFRTVQQGAAYRDEKLRTARAEADAFSQRLVQYRRLAATNPNVREAIWWDEMGRVFQRLKAQGRLDVIDAYLGKDGLDVTQFIPPKGSARPAR